MKNNHKLARGRETKASMESDSDQSVLGSSAASTPSPSVDPQNNPLESNSGKSDHAVECKERQDTAKEPTDEATSEIHVAPKLALETQNLLSKTQELQATAPRRMLWEVICHYERKYWDRLIILTAILLIVLCGIVLALYLQTSPAAKQSLSWEPCPTDEWVYYRKRCYYHNLNGTDWNSSQNFCAEYGATLAVIHMEEDLDSISKICKIDCWIGLHKTDEGLQWVDGTPYNSSLWRLRHYPLRSVQVGCAVPFIISPFEQTRHMFSDSLYTALNCAYAVYQIF
uniref:C-type lectin domain family 2 member D5-like isoform X2 n=1 Tax=Geotrypetes seraphini TaxID=260995 RepID=A0A6P8PLK5_GEOSA|nr:C-type lectin domain family 2 member D5-like isoform X2 [Geotrypetes seraphini]